MESPSELLASVQRLDARSKPGAGNAQPLAATAGASFGFNLLNVANLETLSLLKARVTFLTLLDRSGSTAAGFGRVDAFGEARNSLFPDEPLPTTAPVSYPHLWGVAGLQWLHWDSNSTSILERNLGQALGLGVRV